MTPWERLYREHEALREGPGDAEGSLRRLLKVLVERDHCDRVVMHRLIKQTCGARIEIRLRDSEPLSLRNLPELDEAELDIFLSSSQRGRRLEEYALTLAGRCRTGGAPWLVAVHFTANRQGSGAAGHALLHAHIGPTFEQTPKVRVPLPALPAWEALDWMLTLVLDRYEPLRWEDLLQPKG